MPRFVLLEHVWDGVHWDFMLEMRRGLADLGDRCADRRRARTCRPGACRIIGWSTWSMRARSRATAGRVRRVDAGTYRPLVWSADRVRVELAGSQLVGEVELRRVGLRVGRDGLVDLPHGELRLKDLARRQDRPVESPLGPVGAAGQPDLAGADLNFLELHVLSLEIRRITDEDHGISISSRPLDVDTMVACILDDPVEDVVGGDGQDAGADLFERQLDGVAAGDARPGHHRDHRLDTALA